jgi:predicted RNA-binding Zn-ribbon protein involved in translation (DUF1610 family)
MNDIERTIHRMQIKAFEGNLELEQIAISALEKQIPKKPTEIDYDCNCFVCPSCGETIYASDNLETHKYCLECGQAINWTEITTTEDLPQ